MSLPNEASSSNAYRSEKAAWYREVLDLEPGSKVFLPYSRLLSDMGDSPEAVRVLRSGLERHPEFTEARLFLINLLHQSGDNAACGAEVARLAGLFREYPDFWDAWSDFSVKQGDRSDLSVSLGLLGALFRDRSVTLADVLATGIRSLKGLPAERPQSSPVSVTPVGISPSPAPGSAVSAPAAVRAEPGDAVISFIPDTLGESMDADEAGSSPPPFVFGVSRRGVDYGDEPESVEEKSSLCTLSMAEVLAEQGDVRGAIGIYEELLASAEPKDAPELRDRLESLKARQGDEAIVPVRAVSGSSSGSSSGLSSGGSGSAPLKAAQPKPQGGVLDLLEKLAVRLEIKSRQ